MSSRCIKNEDSFAIKKMVDKYGGLSVSGDYLIGEISIFNYRKYLYHCEIDVQFKGKFAAFARKKKLWYESSIYTNKSYSKIKINRILRKQIYKVLKDRLCFFNIELKHYGQIKKIKWL